MKKKTCIAVFVVAVPLLGQSALAHQGGKASEGYVGDGRTGHLVTNSVGQCLHTSSWSKDLAVEECDAGMMPKKAAAEPAPKPAPVVARPEPKPEPVIEKVSLKAGALFDVGKADLKPAGKSELDAMVSKIKDNNTQIEQVTVTGHTDSAGASDYNRKLSERRAEAVKAYLVSKGLSGDRIVTKGAGDSEPVASNKTAAGRTQNRRVDIDIRAQRTTSGN
ncbi:MAG: OmpA family protein [Gammaproteobacteria bacterium]|nr:OmpA family protein [Gammaproteobacteria bacterium]